MKTNVTISGQVEKRNDRYITDSYDKYYLFTPCDEAMKQGYTRMLLCRPPKTRNKGKHNCYNASSINSLMEPVSYNTPIDVFLTFDPSCCNSCFSDGMKLIRAKTGWEVRCLDKQISIFDDVHVA